MDPNEVTLKNLEHWTKTTAGWCCNNFHASLMSCSGFNDMTKFTIPRCHKIFGEVVVPQMFCQTSANRSRWKRNVEKHLIQDSHGMLSVLGGSWPTLKPGRNPAFTSWSVVFSHVFFRVLYIPGGCLGSQVVECRFPIISWYVYS